MISRGAITRMVLAAAWLLAACGRLAACDVPVFRYALEHWEPDQYVAVILHQGNLNAQQQAAADALTKEASLPDRTAILDTVDIDLQTPHPEWANVIAGSLDRDLPCVVLLYPTPPQPDGTPAETENLRPRIAWSGALDRSCAQRLVDSPVRREIARRLLKGDSVVWVLLNSGDKSADAAAATVLETKLEQLQRDLKLPDTLSRNEQDQADTLDWENNPNRISSGVPLKLAFSRVLLDVGDPDEQVFVSMLRGLADQPSGPGPMAFAVFGRGRSSAPLVAKEITPRDIGAICEFLCNGCACEDKERNPGTSLLMSARWAELLAGSLTVERQFPLTGVLPGTPTTRSQPHAVSAEPAGGSGRLLVSLAVAIGLVTAAVLVVTALLRHGGRRE